MPSQPNTQMATSPFKQNSKPNATSQLVNDIWPNITPSPKNDSRPMVTTRPQNDSKPISVPKITKVSPLPARETQSVTQM